MPTPPKPPDQRRRRNKEQPKRAASTQLPPVNVRKAPPPPAGLAKRLHPAFRAAWRSSVANLWPADHAVLVARLVEDRDELARTRGSGVAPGLRSAILQLERELLLTTKSARASGVTVRDEQPVTIVEDDDEADEKATPPPKRRSISRSRRDRILRAVPD